VFGSEPISLLEASTNKQVAASIGLGLDDDDDDDNGEENMEQPAEVERDFLCEVVLDPAVQVSSDQRVMEHPMIGAVMLKRGNFDAKGKDVLIVRIPAVGLGATVGSPTKINDQCVEIPVRRSNQPDFVRQLDPAVTEERHGQLVTMVNSQVTALYGAHCDYDVINTAFQAMAPRVESWIARVTVLTPYLLGDLKDVLVYSAKNAADALILVPLRTSTPESQEKAQVVNLFE
jgi:hypothetical protein